MYSYSTVIDLFISSNTRIPTNLILHNSDKENKYMIHLYQTFSDYNFTI